MVKITLADGSTFIVKKDTVLNGYKNYSTSPDREYYLEQVFSDSIDGYNSTDGSRIATTNPKIGVMGFILSVDCFSIGTDITNNVLYRSSAVISVQNV